MDLIINFSPTSKNGCRNKYIWVSSLWNISHSYGVFVRNINLFSKKQKWNPGCTNLCLKNLLIRANYRSDSLISNNIKLSKNIRFNWPCCTIFIHFNWMSHSNFWSWPLKKANVHRSSEHELWNLFDTGREPFLHYHDWCFSVHSTNVCFLQKSHHKNMEKAIYINNKPFDKNHCEGEEIVNQTCFPLFSVDKENIVTSNRKCWLSFSISHFESTPL